MKSALVFACASTPIAFLVGNLYVANLLTLDGTPISNLTRGITTLPFFIASGGTPTTEPAALCIGFLLVCAIWITYARHLTNTGTRRDGEEHGSSRWATEKEMLAFADTAEHDNNILFTEKFSMAVKREEFDLLTDRNKNVLVVGSSGSGKTRYYVKPNVMQLNASYLVTDPKGTLLGDVGHMLEAANYRILTFDTIDFGRSNHYNPLAYVKTHADILSFVNCLIKNTTGNEPPAGDPFWPKAEQLFYTANVAYLINHCAEEDRTLIGLLKLISLAEAREGDENYKSPLDMLYEELETGMRYVRTGSANRFDEESRGFDNGDSGFKWVKIADPISPDDDFALSNYKAFKKAAGKTLKSILISCNVRMKPFEIRELKELLSRDELKLDTLGDSNQKTIIVASVSDTDDTFYAIFAILMWQTLNVLCNIALKRHGGSLPTPVHLILDEFATLGTLPGFERTIAVVRSRNIYCSIILQSFAQLKSKYKEDTQTIIDNCDTTLFLGGKSTETNKEISEAIGKQTVSVTTVNETHGASSSTTQNRTKIERDLMQAAEVGRLPRNKAILLISGTFPAMDKKYQLEKHPRYALVDPGHRGSEFKKKFDILEYRIRHTEGRACDAA